MKSPLDQKVRKARIPIANPRPTIAFLTDFGVVDDAVSLFKGQMLSICHDANILDICHEIKPFDVQHGARLLVDLPHFYPPWTVVAAVVYPETGTTTRSIALRVPQGQIYVAPNNGLLTRVIEDHGYVEAYEVSSGEIVPTHPEPTVFGRDLVAVPASHIAAGFPLAEVGHKLSDSEICRIEVPLPDYDEVGRIDGIVVCIDEPFGNVWTNISDMLLEELGLGYGTYLRFTVDDALVFELVLSPTFGDSPVGAPVAYINSRRYLSLGLNQGDLSTRHKIVKGMPIGVEYLCVSADEGLLVTADGAADGD